ncbi:STE24 endopeptidase [Pancytospora epiphaga]|nr:STE24 endopeptidase [Pancytospora epiphaga]
MTQCLIFGVLITNAIISLYVFSRQYRLLGCPQPAISKEYLSADNYAKATAYSKSKCLYSMAMCFFNLVKSIALLFFLPWFYNRYVKNLYKPESLLLAAYYLFNTLVDIPSDLYYDFVLERTHGFNKKTLNTFIKDTIISLFIGGIVTFVVGTASVAFIKSSLEYFYIYWWFFLCVVQLILIVIFPNFISPLYNTFTPLQEGPLKTGVEELASKIGFNISSILTMDGSKRSGHSNAYFTGLGKMKQIVFYDTIIDQLGTEEVLGVLCHELGHWSYGHTYIHMIFSFTNLFFILYGFSKLIVLYKGVPASLQLIYLLFLSGGLTFPLTLLQNLLVRSFERQADQFAVRMQYGQALRSGLINIGIENKTAPVNDPIFSAVHYTHPPLNERLSLIDAEMKKEK